VYGGGTDWATLTAGDAGDSGDGHTCGVKTGGTAWCWGGNGLGQLGNDSRLSSAVPVQVYGGGTDWATLTAGDAGDSGDGHTCGVKTSGTAWCWGDIPVPPSGGDGWAWYSPRPVQVPG
jgi:hypothetical protein